MEPEYTLPVIVLSFFFWVWVMYEIIKAAVKSANRDMNYNLKMQNRLLIKQLEKMGVSKKELMDIHFTDSDAFWETIHPDKPASAINISKRGI